MQEKVVKTMPITTAQEAEQYFRRVGAAFRRMDEAGLPLYKSNAGVVFRLNGPMRRIEILSNCAC